MDDAGNPTPCVISRWKYRPALGYNNSNGTPAIPLQVEPNWPDGNANCLSYKAHVSNKPIVCQTCHYTPALDLAQVGPLGGSAEYPDDGVAPCPPNAAGDGKGGQPELCVANGRAQRVRPSMSGEIHTIHVGAVGRGFVMPSPANTGTNPGQRNYIVTGPLDTTCNPPNPTTGLQQVAGSRLYAQCNACTSQPWDECVEQSTCYNCHPGKATKCLRGAMEEAGSKCQDCHGNLAQVGNDFSGGMSIEEPFPVGANLAKRIPWANEPGCQSCHVGDAVNYPKGADANGFIYAKEDGANVPFLLLQAWNMFTYPDTTTAAKPIEVPDSRFAEDQAANGQRVLYRFSKGGAVTLPSGDTALRGHQGVACQMCHGSTHAEWPVTPDAPNGGAWPPPSGSFVANDNVMAGQLQGHTGKIIECDTCHTGTFALNTALNGPHNLHPVGSGSGNYSQWWVSNHGGYLGQNPTKATLNNQCGICHGKDGAGTILSEVAMDRVVKVPDFVYKGKKVKVKNQKVTLNAGEAVSCSTCHVNPFGPIGPAAVVVAAP